MNKDSLILHGGRVHTGDARDSVAEAVAIAGERIVAVGRDGGILALAPPGARRIDLRGRTVVPGMIDSHGHLLTMGLSLLALNLAGVESFDALVERTAAFAAEIPKGQWVVGRGWDHTLWPGMAMPTRHALSRATPDHPVALKRVDGHALLANAAALRLAGIGRETPDPPGGRIVRDPASSEPTGVLVDAAMYRLMSLPPAPSPDEIRRAVQAAIRECLRHGLTMEAGFQVAVHAIGDRANRLALDGFESVLRDSPGLRDLRPRIEHAQIVAPEDIPRFAALGVIPVMQTIHATEDMRLADRRLGPSRVEGAYAWRTFLDCGSRIANGSDFPVASLDPLAGIHAAVTRQDARGNPAGGWRPEQRMTAREALRSYTLDAAFAAFEEDEKGSIEPGKLADLAVLSEDILAIEPRRILDTRVEFTILGGRLMDWTQEPPG